MDSTDFSIVEVLKENSRATASEISKRVNLSVPAVAERIRKMEQANIIRKYTVKINREKIGYNLLAFVLVNIDTSVNIDTFRIEIVKHNCVLECHHITGLNDYLLKILVKDTLELENFLTNILKRIKGVVTSNTIISLSTLKEELNI